MSAAKHTPGNPFSCVSCGWSGIVRGRARCLPCYARRTALWRANNPDAAKKLRRKWRASKGPEYEAKRKRIRRANNPKISREAWDRRAEWLRSGDVTKDDLISIVTRDGSSCVYCSKTVAPRLTPSDPRGFDHVVPRAAGGRHTKANLVVCCGSCNASKSAQVRWTMAAIAAARGEP